MGGFPKGLLIEPTRGLPVVGRLLELAQGLLLHAVFVGDASPYRQLAPTLPELRDAPPGIGPLGGLVALLRAAADAPVLCVACDMPFVTAELLLRLRDEHRDAAALAPRTAEGLWEPLCARYHAPSALRVCEAMLAEGQHSLQHLLTRLSARVLAVDAHEAQQLTDWDAPGDMRS